MEKEAGLYIHPSQHYTEVSDVKTSHRNDVTISAPCQIIDGDKFADEKNDDFEPHGGRIDEYRPYGESLTEDYVDEDFDSEYSEEFVNYYRSNKERPDSSNKK